LTLGKFKYTTDELRRLAKCALRQEVPASAFDFSLPSGRSDFDLNPDYCEDLSVAPRAAAVLIAIINHENGAQVLLTRRPENMASHPGQVAFPGGKVEKSDDSIIAAALREANEEVGLDPSLVDIVGYLDTYQTGSGFRITPVVGLVPSTYQLELDRREVDEAFEVPLEFLMTVENHQKHSRVWQGKNRAYYAMPYGDKFIWGATAGMLINFYDRIYRD